MATPIIQSTGSTSGAGTAGQSRKDIQTGETVTMSDTEVANSGASYQWALEDIPFGSSASLASPTSATPLFVPDVVGSYRISCEVNGTDTAQVVLVVVTANLGLVIPSTGETTENNEGGNTEGWAKAMYDNLVAIDSGSGGGGSALEVEDEGSSLSTAVTKINFVGAGVTATEPTSDEIEVNIPGGGTDADAIHDNVAGEIAAIAAKATPTAADVLLIEDAADSNNKKRITIGDLPTSVGGTGGGWELADEILPLVTADTEFLFGTGGDGVNNEALDGDTYHYMLELYISRQTTAAALIYALEPNALTNDQYYTNFHSNNSLLQDTVNLRIADSSSSTEINVRAELFFESGRGQRHGVFDTTFDTAFRYTGSFRWSETTVPMTSLRLRPVNGTMTAVESFDVGSWARLYRRRIDGQGGGQGGGTAGSTLEVEDEGSSLSTAVTKINFVGAGVTATEPSPGEIQVSVPGGSTGGGWELADEILPLTTAQTADLLFGVGGDGTVNEALDGDTYYYMLVGHISRVTTPGNTVGYVLRPNGLTAAGFATRYSTNTGSLSATSTTRLTFTRTQTASATSKAELFFESGRGSRLAPFDTVVDGGDSQSGVMSWNNTSTVMTSLGIAAEPTSPPITAAQTFGVGTWFRLYRRSIA